MPHPLAALLLAATALLLAACSPGRPLVSLSVNRDSLSADGREAPLTINYQLARPALVDLYVQRPGQPPLYLRRGESRPAGSDYQYAFDGSYPLPDRPAERRVLPDGSYRLVLSAEAAGLRQEAAAEVAIRNADTTPPAIDGLAIAPAVLSPNFDGLDDGITISYRLTKAARVSILTADPRGRRLYVSPPMPRQPGEQRERWDGLDSRQLPLPDGEYTLTVQAVDAANNVSTASAGVRLASGGRPEARLIDVSFYPRQVMVGQVLHVRFTVRNTGATVLRTQGPPPGFLYSSYDTYTSILDRQFVDRAGVWRVGVDWAGSPAGAVAKYPYRWGLGRDLAPGEEATVDGQIRLEHGPLQDRQAGPPNNRVYFYAGLVQENMAFFDDKVGGTWIEIGY